ncbi:MAG: DEAD/DEAH box helicase, partial [Halanaerobium sp.]|nr:DEAD/DEAH box helicase [Halanaerobium sp.]
MARLVIAEEAKRQMRERIKTEPDTRHIFQGDLLAGEIVSIRYVGSITVGPLDAELLNPLPGKTYVINHPGADLSPSPEEIRLAARLDEAGAGLVIVDNRQEAMEVIVEPEKRDILAVQDVLGFFSAGGPLSKAIPSYEYRQQQLRMAEGVTNSFNKDRHLLVEAGTGTGKTFAYLVPAILYGMKAEEKIVVSTNTINLQEQLIDKDLPALLQALGNPSLHAILVKGRNNYLCRRRLDNQLRWNKDSFTLAEQGLLLKIREELPELKEGTRQELGRPIKSWLWQEINSQRERCLRSSCPYLQRCFFFRARNEVEKADILVVNHHLLFADLKLKLTLDQKDGGGILPPYSYLIIDEAHNLEDVAAEYFGYDLQVSEVFNYLSRLYEKRQNKGLLPELRQFLAQENKQELQLLDGLISQVLGLQEQFSAFYTTLEKSIQLKRGGSFRLQEDFYSAEFIRDHVQVDISKFLDNMDGFLTALAKLDKILGDIEYAEEEQLLHLELQAHQNFGKALQQATEFILMGVREGFVAWVERGGEHLSFYSRPIQVSGYLQEHLFAQKSAAVLTSATLTVRGNFSYLRENLGMDGLTIDELVI